eukprot:COSAG02_NODE_4486_length_5301_cov_3.420223_1_plen_60_part_10
MITDDAVAGHGVEDARVQVVDHGEVAAHPGVGPDPACGQVGAALLAGGHPERHGRGAARG